MEQKYLVYNPINGENISVQTEDEALAIATQLAVSTYMTLSHNSPVTIMVTDDQEVSTITNINGEVLADNISKNAQITKTLLTNALTPVEIL